MSVEHVHALASGTRLNQYEVMNILGAGGFGITYMARDTSLDTMVAIKEYLPGDLAVRQGDSQVTAKSSISRADFDWGLDRFLAEARTLAKFRHPNIVRVNQIFQANNTAYLVMEYAKGQSLDDLLRNGPLTEEQTNEILTPILDGLKRVHAQGFLHRDIKPGNIIIREEGGAVLIDFGAARQAIETKSRAITSIVTEGYAPLEQYDGMGNQGPWTDIYALGAVAYKCLTGNKPPSATSRVRSDPLVPLAVACHGKISPTFAAAIEAALRVYENLRPQSVADFTAMIEGKMAVPSVPAISDDATRVLTAEPATQIVRPGAVHSYAPTPSGRPGAKASTLNVSALVAPASPPASVAVQEKPPARRNTPAYLGVAAVALLAVAGAWYVQNGSGPQVTATAPAAPPARTQAIAPQVDVSANVAPAAPPPSNTFTTASVPPPPPPPAVMTGPPVPAAPTAPAPQTTPPAPQATAPLASPPAAATRPVPSPNATAKAPPAAKAPPPQPAIASPPPAPTIQASFDCRSPGNAAERIVCSDGQLAALDVKMAELYAVGMRSVADTNAFRGEQQTWLAQRDVCGDKSCLAESYGERIKELERWVGP